MIHNSVATLTLAQIFLIFLTPFVHLKLGHLLLHLVSKSRKQVTPSLSLVELYFPGLAIYIAMIFLLRSSGLPWLLTSLLSLTPLFYRHLTINEILRSIRQQKITWNFALWFSVILTLGVSLMDVTAEIKTLWVNSYGDLAFHIGNITSFALGDNFPPQNHTMAGIPLTYPFFINVWSASLWWVDPTFSSLHLIFLTQWVVLWCTVYYLLEGNTFKILPWAVLFGGGSLLALGSHSGKNIEANFPWSVFITTIWIPQRTALLGMTGLLTVVSQFHRFQREKKPDYNRLVFLTVTLSLLPLIHTHMFLVTTLYIGGMLLPLSRESNFKPLLLFAGFMILSVIWLPWLLGKESIIFYRPGWMPWVDSKAGDSKTLIGSIWGTAKMWLFNNGIYLTILVILGLMAKARRPLIILGVLFLLANGIHFAVWEWDQIKIFVAIYLITLTLWTKNGLQGPLIKFHYILLVTLIPAMAECGLVLKEFKNYTIYSTTDLKVQKDLLELTPKDAIILADPIHNSPVTLSGRKLFMGYPGTLYSHGLDYRDREALLSSISKALNCRDEENINSSFRPHCPTHLLWTDQEIKRWGKLSPPLLSKLRATRSPYIYEIVS